VADGGFVREPIAAMRLCRVEAMAATDPVLCDADGVPLDDSAIVETSGGGVLARATMRGWCCRFASLAEYVADENARRAMRREHARRCIARRDAYYAARAAGLVKVNAELEHSDQCGARQHFERELQIVDLVPVIVEPRARE
jgi:hypothetical protein